MAAADTTAPQIPFFQQALLKWFDRHGRKNLPWQQQKTAYHIWISEIMLQQTQVETVIPYYQKFMQRFPHIQTLAEAAIDDVLTLWAGLGYYARARNLHKTANIICQQYNGEFPDSHDQVITLPGIGRSTASAILAFAFNQHHSILDGNVKRVITRFFAISGYPGKKKIENQLWQLVDQLTPTNRVADYTQAIMDLGATVCTRSKPQCLACPIKNHCQAQQQNRQKNFPTPKTKTPRPLCRTRMLMICNHDNHVFLKKRPPTGIWGGLWSLPQIDDANINAHQWCQSSLFMNVQQISKASSWKHGFTHFELEIELLHYQLIDYTKDMGAVVSEPNKTAWLDPQHTQTIALPAVISKMMHKLC